MPKVEEIETFLFSIAPKNLAMDWDNVGLLVGETRNTVKSVVVALDITEDVVEEAIAANADLIISHHPVMNCKWSPVQSVRDDNPQGRVLTKLIQNHISAICMHTNLDCAKDGVNDVLAKAIGLTKIEPLADNGLGRIGVLSRKTDAEDFVAQVCQALGANGVRYVSNGRDIKKVAVGGGACFEMLDEALRKGCDAFVTADLGYHDFLDAKAKGATVLDAGHFPTEDVICDTLVKKLQAKYPKVKIKKSTSHKEVIEYYKQAAI